MMAATQHESTNASLTKCTLTPAQRAIVVAATAVAYLTWFFPGAQARAWVQSTAGYPAYQGAWLLFEHIFLYTTIPAVMCLLVWTQFAHRGWLPNPWVSLGLGRGLISIVRTGLISGLAVVCMNALLVAIALARGQAPSGIGFGWCAPDGWVVAGNLFSNFYEEIIYRGLVFTALATVLGGPWIALVLSSLIFGLGHTHYPIAFQLVVAIMGASETWAYLRSRSLWAAWMNHMVVDILMDILIPRG